MTSTKQLIRSGRGATDISRVGKLSFLAEIALDTLDTSTENTQWYRYLKLRCKKMDGWWSVNIKAKKIVLEYEEGGWFSQPSVSITGRGNRYSIQTVTEVKSDVGEYDELNTAVQETYQDLVDHLTERMQTEKELQEMEYEAVEELEDVLGELDINQMPDYQRL